MNISLTLYVSGETSHSAQARRNLSAIVDSCPDHVFRVHVVDVREHPEEAERYRLLATPTLVRESPEPIRKLVGDLSDRTRVLETLELATGGEGPLPGKVRRPEDRT